MNKGGVCVARLACIPNLRLDGLFVDRQRPGREFYANGRLGVEVEFVTSEPRQHCGRNVQEIMYRAATRVLWTYGFCSRVVSSSVRPDNPRVPKCGTHDFPTPESPIKTTCQRFRFASPFSTYAGKRQTDLEEEIKVAAFSHDCKVCKEKKREVKDKLL